MAKAGSGDPGFVKLIGLEETRREAGLSASRLEVHADLLNPHGTLHGGVMYSMADNGMGAALYTLLEEAESCATIEITMAYIAAVTAGTLTCETRVINKGRRVALLESEIRNGERLVAKAMGSFAIFPQR